MSRRTITIGMDLGDKKHLVCIINADGSTHDFATVSNTESKVKQFFRQYSESRVVLEAGTHSPWISRVLEGLGCKVLIGNPRKLRMIWSSHNKSDMRDAEMLARIGRFDSQLLHPIRHRCEQSQVDLNIIKARDILVKNRSSLINHMRGSVKSLGSRIPSCSAPSFYKQAQKNIPEKLKDALGPVIKLISDLTEQIKLYDQEIKKVSEENYPETKVMQQISGVGPITALAFSLTIEDPGRFRKSRDIGPFLGLTPRRDQSGDIDKQLRITKAGNKYLRRLLVGCAQYVLGPFGPETDLRQFGLNLAARGGKNAKRRATVAVARKLSVLMHRLWMTGEVYQPVGYVFNQKVA